MSSSKVLHTKFLVPRYSRDRLVRPHLVELLNQRILSQRLILISAPPGYGKTTLLAALTESTQIPHVYYQLDPFDGDPATFLAYLIEAIQQIKADIWLPNHIPGTAARSLLESVQASLPVLSERILAVLINEIGESVNRDFFIVLEDYHVITNPSVHNLVEYLIENAPEQLHLVMSTRSDPPLALSRLRARGLLTELRTSDLRFNEDEIRQWLMKDMPNLSTKSLEALTAKTEGWAASLQLVLSSLVGKDAEQAEQFIMELTGSHRHIFDYLADEVFSRQPGEIREFLLASAVLAQMNADACNTLIGGNQAQAILRYLVQNNLLVTILDDKGDWYRYHYLFQEFLLAKLRREEPDRLLALEQVAASYYEAHGEPEVALTHYLKAGDSESAARVLKSFARDYIERGRANVLQRYLNMIPESILRGMPHLLLVHGDVLRQLSQVGASIARYEDALLEFSKLQDYGGKCRALTALAEVARSQGDYRRAQARAVEALTQSPPDDHAGRAHALMALAKSEGFLSGMVRGRALAEEAVNEARQAGETITRYSYAALLHSLGQICWWHGDPQASVRYCQEARNTIPDELSPITARCAITMATPYMYWRDLDTARHYAELGLDIAEQLQLTELLPRAYMTLGSVLTRCGEIARAEGCLRRAMEMSQRLGVDSYEQVMTAGFLAHNLCRQGRFDEAQQQAESVFWAYADHSDTYEMVVCRSVLADVALEMGQLERAEELFKSLVAVGERRQFRIPLGMVYFGLAYIALKTARQDEACDLAKQSLAMIEPSGALQLYLDQGQRARELCLTLAEAGHYTPFVTGVLESLHASVQPRTDIKILAPPILRLVCLGSFRVFDGTRELGQKQWVSTKARDLLAYFATYRHERIPVERIIDALWPDAEQQNRSAFNTALYRLRNALRRRDDQHACILVEAGEYWIDTSQFQIDVDEFERLIKQAQRSAPDLGAELLESAIQLYSGEYLNNLYYDWLVVERQHLEQLYLRSLQSLASYRARSDDYQSALSLSRRALVIDPLLEDVHCNIMEYLSALGDRAGVMRQYQHLREILWDEIAADPLPTSQELYRRLISTPRC